jgi:uncharacterized SAM-binding protein YcdF (DUF218 family)
MFFILSKLLNFLFSPAFWLVLGLGVLYKLRNERWRKRVLLAILAVFLLFSNRFFVNEMWLLWEVAPTPLEQVGKYEVGIVLTGVTQPYKEPHDRIYFEKGADRIYHALLLYRRGNISKILISGAPHIEWHGGTQGAQTQDIEQLLWAAGVPKEDVILEQNSRNTHENALYSREALQQAGVEGKSLLITSAFHLRRAKGCFEKAGVSVDVFSTDFYTVERGYALSPVPSEKSFFEMGKLIHEIMGYIVYALTGKI